MSSVNQVNRNISELTPLAQTACNLFMSRCEDKGLKVLITETYRSQERQNYLYEQGRSRSGKIVTWTKKSRHTGRRAWDICQNIKGKEYSDSGFFKACGDVAEELGITWGGTWPTPDTPHFEIRTDWIPPTESEETDMSELNALKEEITNLRNEIKNLTVSLNKTADRITKLENPMIYNYIDKNMPEWARSTVQKLTDNNVLAGNGEGELGLTDEMLRILVVLDRVGAFDNN